MNGLRKHVLHEVTQLDIKSLVAVHSVVEALKKTTSVATQKRGIGAARCREVLSNIKDNLGKVIVEEREDRV